MAAPWEKVNPDSAVDRLPQPFRLINKVLDDVLDAVGEQIDQIEKRRRSEEYEFALKTAPATSCLPIIGRVTCAYAELRPSHRLVIGTSIGEAMVIDSRIREGIARKYPFGEGEAIHCICLSQTGSYEVHPPSAPRMSNLKPSSKLLVAGTTTPKVLVYTLVKGQYGVSLKPFCVINVPVPEVPAEIQAAIAARDAARASLAGSSGETAGDAKGKKDAKGKAAEAAATTETNGAPTSPREIVEPRIPDPPAPVQELIARGTCGAFWVTTLLPDRTVRVFLCPLGPPEGQGEKQDGAGQEDLAKKPIMEDEEDEEEEGEHHHAGRGEVGEFEGLTQIDTPKYLFSLPQMASMPGGLEPDLSHIRLTVFTVKPESISRAGVNQMPTFVFVTSTHSNLLFAYGLKPPAVKTGTQALQTSSAADGAAPFGADGAADADALMKLNAPPAGTLEQPTESISIEPRRRWMLPAETTAIAISCNGGLFVAGGAKGVMAVINAAAGPSLRSMLPGHYAAVSALAFHKADNLVSVGMDAWVHQYNMRTDTLMFRCLISPPPSPSPGSSVCAWMFGPPLALVLDQSSNLRLIDLRQHRKVAKALVHDDGGEWTTSGHEAQQPPPDVKLGRMLSTASAFCVFSNDAPSTEKRGSQPNPGLTSTARESTTSEFGGGEAKRSWVIFFDYTKTLCSLYPGIAARVRQGERALELFETLTPHEMEHEPELDSPKAAPLLGHSNTRGFGKNSRVGGSQISRSNTGSVDQSGTNRMSTFAKKKSSSFYVSGPPADGDLSPRSVGSVNKGVAKLTAENLKRIGKGRRTVDSSRRNEEDPGSPRSMGDPAGDGHRGTLTAALKKSVDPSAIPENWQVGVRAGIHAAIAEKNLRASRITRRIEGLRRDLEAMG